MRIRDGKMDDLETLVDMNAKMAWETEQKRLDPAVLRNGVRRVLEDQNRGRYFVAIDPELVGCLMVTTEWSDWRDGWFWWIQSVYVDESARRRGVYRALHEHVLSAAKDAGDVVGVRLYVEPQNARAQSTYARLGMKETYRVMEQPIAIRLPSR
jgi:ribosomal protein S18 acetylase RimI-like enzyme